MKVDLYNQEGKITSQVEVPGGIFDVKLSKDLLHQVAVSQMANRRQGNAHTKDRGDVSGGGKKPWRQKGTGRARAGSTRSPLWKGGGVTFGPTNEKVYKKIVPKKIKRAALFMALTEKAKNNLVILVEDLKIKEAKTKLATSILGKMPTNSKTTLIALPEMDKNFILASRNIEKVKVMQVKDLSALDVLNNKYLIMPRESIEVMKKIYGII